MADFAHLFERFPRMHFEEGYSLSRHTTIGCGGEARVCAFPESDEAALELITYLKREKVPHFFLGVGANVLPGDGDYEGVIVTFCRMHMIKRDGELFLVQAGATGGALCKAARRGGIGGFEAFTGIPMSVGGGVVMNAGVAEGHFSDVVLAVKAIEGGKIRLLSAEECGFSEKKSVFQEGIAVLEVFLRGYPAPAEEIERRTRFFRERRLSLPKGRSMGCTFVNPPGISAGKLIDLSGCKGMTIGGARVSEEHANFILNEGGTSRDVSALISAVKERVKERTGIVLREEIRRLE